MGAGMAVLCAGVAFDAELLRHSGPAAAELVDAARRGRRYCSFSPRSLGRGSPGVGLAGSRSLSSISWSCIWLPPAAMGAGDVKLAIGVGALTGAVRRGRVGLGCGGCAAVDCTRDRVAVPCGIDRAARPVDVSGRGGRLRRWCLSKLSPRRWPAADWPTVMPRLISGRWVPARSSAGRVARPVVPPPESCWCAAGPRASEWSNSV